VNLFLFFVGGSSSTVLFCLLEGPREPFGYACWKVHVNRLDMLAGRYT
jgi:hypothetical protein